MNPCFTPLAGILIGFVLLSSFLGTSNSPHSDVVVVDTIPIYWDVDNCDMAPEYTNPPASSPGPPPGKDDPPPSPYFFSLIRPLWHSSVQFFRSLMRVFNDVKEQKQELRPDVSEKEREYCPVYEDPVCENLDELIVQADNRYHREVVLLRTSLVQEWQDARESEFSEMFEVVLSTTGVYVSVLLIRWLLSKAYRVLFIESAQLDPSPHPEGIPHDYYKKLTAFQQSRPYRDAVLIPGHYQHYSEADINREYIVQYRPENNWPLLDDQEPGWEVLQDMIPPRAAGDNRPTLVIEHNDILNWTTNFILPSDNIDNVWIRENPNAKQFLEIVSQVYEIIVWTSLTPRAADRGLNALDQNGLISHRLYRHDCTVRENGVLIKDLYKLGRDMKRLILIDRTPHSFLTLFQRNLVEVETLHQMDSYELLKYAEFLTLLVQFPDFKQVLDGSLITDTHLRLSRVNPPAPENV